MVTHIPHTFVYDFALGLEANELLGIIKPLGLGCLLLTSGTSD